MAKSSQNESRRALRVGVIQRDRVINEILVRDPQPIHVGTDPTNDLTIGADGTPANFLLFEPQGGGYTIHLDATMYGQMELGGESRAITSGTRIDLNDDVRGKVAMGGTTIVFETLTPPPLLLLPPVPAAMKLSMGYVLTIVFGLSIASFVALLVSAVIHGGLLAWGYLQPPPVRDDGALMLNARLTRLITAVDDDDEEFDDVELEDDGDLIVEDGEGDVSSAGADTKSDTKGGRSGGDSDGALTGIDQVVQGSALAGLVGADGGLNLGLVAADSASELSAAEALRNQQASGATGGGVVAKNLGGIGSGKGDGSGRIGVGGDGSSEVLQAAQADMADAGKKQVKVKANVSGKGNRLAGSGTLSESEVKGVLGRFQKRVTRCYERTLASNPSAGGRVELQFRVDQNGQATDARMPTNELGDGFGNCLLTEVRRLRFSPPKGGPVTVSQRYVLQPSN